MLAVEIHSPVTKAYDLGPKKGHPCRRGLAPSYWTIDPAEPELTAWSLEGDQYIETARAAAQETSAATEPFTVTITPVELLDL